MMLHPIADKLLKKIAEFEQTLNMITYSTKLGEY